MSVTTIDEVSWRGMLSVPFRTATWTTKSAEKFFCEKLLGISRAIVVSRAWPGKSSTGRPVAVLVWDSGGSAGAVMGSLMRVTLP